MNKHIGFNALLRVWVTIVLFYCAFICPADAADGIWRKYLNGNDIFDMTVSGDGVWCATDGGLIYWDRNGEGPVHYTRDNGLLSNQLSMAVKDDTGSIWIGYDTIPQRTSITRFDGDEWTTYDDTNSGLPDAKVRSAYFAKDGTWWIGSVWAGVSRYDGNSWETFVPDNVLASAPRKLVTDRDGRLWIAGTDGVWTFDGDEWHNYSTEDGLASNSVNDIAIDEDNVKWFATTNGVSVFDGSSWTTLTKADGLVNNLVNCLAIDGNGDKWFGTDYGLSRYDGSSWITYTGSRDLVDDKVTGIAVDGFNNVWTCHRDAAKGITKFDGNTWIWYTIWSPYADLPSNEIVTVAADDYGIVWFGTAKGLVRYDGSTWTTFTEQDGLPGYSFGDMFVDDDNKLWIAHGRYEKTGATLFDGNNFTTYTEEDGLKSNNVLTVTRGQDGTVYFGTTYGLTVFDGTEWISYPDDDRLISPSIFDIVQDIDGAMWFATSKGIAQFDGSSWHTYYLNDPLADDMVYVETDAQGTVWIRSSFGYLMSVSDGILERHRIEHEDISENSDLRIVAFTLDRKGVVWAATDDGTRFDETMNCWTRDLWSYNGVTWRRHLMTTDLSFDSIRVMDADEDGVIWIATDTGLRRFDDPALDTYLVDGPVDNYIRDFAVDSFNGKAFSTDRGVSFYKGNGWVNIPGESRRNIEYDSDNNLWLTDGLGVLTYDGSEWTLIDTAGGFDFYRTVTYETDRDGVMWIGTNMGLWKYDSGEWIYYDENRGGIVDGIKDIAVDRAGVVWMTVGLNNGLWSYDGAEFRSLYSVDGLAFDRTTQVVVDNLNRKWIGTVKGLSCYNDTTWTTYTTADGIPSNNITALAVDYNDVIWVGTDSGAARYANGTWETFTDENGLVDNDILSIGVDRNNVKWIGTSHGLSSFDDRNAGVDDGEPRAIRLMGNFPNPFNVQTTIDFELNEWGNLDLDIYNITGQKVRTFVFRNIPAGRKQIIWNGRDDEGATVSSGVYLYRIRRGGFSVDGKMMLVK